MRRPDPYRAGVAATGSDRLLGHQLLLEVAQADLGVFIDRL
jgi:hypothetical protein